MALRADCLRAGAVRLSLALMFGLLVVSGYVVAPQLFAHAGNRMLAGMLAGHVFHVANIGVMLLGVAVLLFWLRGGAGRLSWLLLIVALVLVALNEFVVAPEIQSLKAMAPDGIDALPKEGALHKQFALWHGISAMLHLLASLAMAVLVALGGMRTRCGAS
ncbi:MAG: DUF4149 domain-containing protein [Zetaproteobacteria bacterium]|nr:MAG: DUF4149 domain-containing protein [Zetaproteobacteria bacterium]